MTHFKNPYDAVIADLEARRTEIDSALQLMKRLRDNLPPSTETNIFVSDAGRISAGNAASIGFDFDAIPSDAFFNMTIADAAIKFLRMVERTGRRPQSTKAIMEAFERGALKGKKYATVYAVLNRRQQTEGDIVNIHGDWGLAEWYGIAKKRSAPQRAVSMDPATFIKDGEEDEAEEQEPEKAAG